jgi:CheY-like chemotaxis protein
VSATRERGLRPGGLKVVVVDDDKHWRELAAEPFRKRGDHVRVTSDGLQGLALCVEDPPDVILADVQMPRMDGYQLLRLIRARPELRRTPVVFMTSLDGESARLKGYQLGVDAYVPKPFQPEELLVRVHKLLRSKQQMSLGPPSNKIGLFGDLEHVTAPSLLSFLAIEKKTGVLVVVGKRVARIFIRDGQLVRAELEGTVPQPPGREVVLSMLDWTQGQFELIEQPVSGPDQIRADVSALLIDHARQVDEGKR